jgi:hypothetical protein
MINRGAALLPVPLPSLRLVAVLEALPSEVALPVAAVASLVVALPAATSAVALTTSLATARLRP